MTTYTQDYAALPGSAAAAAQHAWTVVRQHQPGRADDAAEIVRLMVLDALTRTPPQHAINVITTASAERIRFEVLDPGEMVPGAVPPEGVQATISRLADGYGGSRDPDGSRRAYAEIVIYADVR